MGGAETETRVSTRACNTGLKFRALKIPIEEAFPSLSVLEISDAGNTGNFEVRIKGFRATVSGFRGHRREETAGALQPPGAWGTTLHKRQTQPVAWRHVALLQWMVLARVASVALHSTSAVVQLRAPSTQL